MGEVEQMEEIMVSIWCITYNHEPYIRDAIEGFLAQKTNFRYEIILHDDASTDETARIVREYEEKYPDLIQGIYQTENQFGRNQPSLEWLWEIQERKCRGKYIAVCEGDDYWIDVQKLQIQTDYLEAHPECMMTVHDTVELDMRDGKVLSWSLYAGDCEVPVGDIITQDIFIPTASMVYRREVLRLDKFFLRIGFDDYPYMLYSLTKGNIYYFSRIMSVYRRYHKGSWSVSVQDADFFLIHNIWVIDFLIKYNDYTMRKYEKYLLTKIQRHVDAVIRFYRKGMPEILCGQKVQDLEEGYGRVYGQLCRVWHQTYDMDYVDREVLDFAGKHSGLVVMGAGRYAGILTEQLLRQGIQVEGYVVSNGRKHPNRYRDKPVWELGELSSGGKHTGVAVGINPVDWRDIAEALEEAGVEEYVCPFLFKL